LLAQPGHVPGQRRQHGVQATAVEFRAVERLRDHAVKRRQRVHRWRGATIGYGVLGADAVEMLMGLCGSLQRGERGRKSLRGEPRCQSQASCGPRPERLRFPFPVVMG
jgi:hypothetical protein